MNRIKKGFLVKGGPQFHVKPFCLSQAQLWCMDGCCFSFCLLCFCGIALGAGHASGTRSPA